MTTIAPLTPAARRDNLNKFFVQLADTIRTASATGDHETYRTALRLAALNRRAYAALDPEAEAPHLPELESSAGLLVEQIRDALAAAEALEEQIQQLDPNTPQEAR